MWRWFLTEIIGPFLSIPDGLDEVAEACSACGDPARQAACRIDEQ